MEKIKEESKLSIDEMEGVAGGERQRMEIARLLAQHLS